MAEVGVGGGPVRRLAVVPDRFSTLKDPLTPRTTRKERVSDTEKGRDRGLDTEKEGRDREVDTQKVLEEETDLGAPVAEVRVVGGPVGRRAVVPDRGEGWLLHLDRPCQRERLQPTGPSPLYHRDDWVDRPRAM